MTTKTKKSDVRLPPSDLVRKVVIARSEQIKTAATLNKMSDSCNLPEQHTVKLLQKLINNPNRESLKLSLMDCHVPGLMSLVLDGEPGTLTRVFLARKSIKPGQVALHSHRYDLKITILTDGIWHQVSKCYLKNAKAFQLHHYTYQSAINGNGKFVLKGLSCRNLETNALPIYSEFEINADLVHTMWCKSHSIWCVQEQGYSRDVVHVYGKPFSTTGLYKPATEFEIAEAIAELRGVL